MFNSTKTAVFARDEFIREAQQIAATEARGAASHSIVREGDRERLTSVTEARTSADIAELVNQVIETRMPPTVDKSDLRRMICVSAATVPALESTASSAELRVAPDNAPVIQPVEGASNARAGGTPFKRAAPQDSVDTRKEPEHEKRRRSLLDGLL